MTSSSGVIGARDARGSKSVSTVYCLVKESVQECCQAMLLRAESLKVKQEICHNFDRINCDNHVI